jgi:hypothetical protein
MFRHAHSIGALLMLSAFPFLVACDDDSSILGPHQKQEEVTQMAMPASVTLEVGQAIRFTLAGRNPDGTKREIRWSSSNPQVATVSKRGVVRALSEGTVMIAADCGSYCTYASVKVVPAGDGQ